MEISISEAKGQLSDLVKQAENGEEVILTRHGQPAVRLVRVKRKLSPQERDAVLQSIVKDGARKASPGPSAARSQDYLYDEFGLPR